ncbi:MAG: Grx4 family monothiol glutaredoxin [Rickettsiales bacterium]
MTDINTKITNIINENAVVLFMKGNQTFPQCGFSGFVVQILKQYGISFHDVDVLQDSELRQAIKDYTDWPTIPQLYVQGEFIGGCDILKEMHEAGELSTLFAKLNK